MLVAKFLSIFILSIFVFGGMGEKEGLLVGISDHCKKQLEYRMAIDTVKLACDCVSQKLSNKSVEELLYIQQIRAGYEPKSSFTASHIDALEEASFYASKECNNKIHRNRKGAP